MKHIRSISVILAATLLCAAWAMAVAGDDGPPAGEPVDLAAEVARLRERVAELEQRLADLEQRQPLVFTVPEATPDYVPRALPRAYPYGQTKRPTRVWGEGEINGIPYYFVPLQEAAVDRSMPPTAGQLPAAPAVAPEGD